MKLTPIASAGTSRRLPGAPTVDPRDLRALLAETTPGATYRTSDLYARYVELTETAGREPAPKRSLGVALAPYGERARRRVPDCSYPVHAWTIR